MAGAVRRAAAVSREQLAAVPAVAAAGGRKALRTVEGSGSWVGVVAAMVGIAGLYLLLRNTSVVANVVTDISHIIERIVAPVPLF